MKSKSIDAPRALAIIIEQHEEIRLLREAAARLEKELQDVINLNNGKGTTALKIMDNKNKDLEKQMAMLQDQVAKITGADHADAVKFSYHHMKDCPLKHHLAVWFDVPAVV